MRRVALYKCFMPLPFTLLVGVLAVKVVREMTCYVLRGTLNLTHQSGGGCIRVSIREITLIHRGRRQGGAVASVGRVLGRVTRPPKESNKGLL